MHIFVVGARWLCRIDPPLCIDPTCLVQILCWPPGGKLLVNHSTAAVNMSRPDCVRPQYQPLVSGRIHSHACTYNAVQGQIFLDSFNPILENAIKPRLMEGKREPCELKVSDFDDAMYTLEVREFVLHVLSLTSFHALKTPPTSS